MSDFLAQCSSCLATVTDAGVTACPRCGSKRLVVIRRENSKPAAAAPPKLPARPKPLRERKPRKPRAARLPSTFSDLKRGAVSAKAPPEPPPLPQPRYWPDGPDEPLALQYFKALERFAVVHPDLVVTSTIDGRPALSAPMQPFPDWWIATDSTPIPLPATPSGV